MPPNSTTQILPKVGVWGGGGACVRELHVAGETGRHTMCAVHLGIEASSSFSWKVSLLSSRAAEIGYIDVHVQGD